MRTRILLVTLAASLTLAACGGGGAASGGSSLTPPTGGGGTTSTQSTSEAAIETANAVGDPVKTLASFNSNTTGVMLASRGASAQVVPMASGTCNGGVEFFAPDKNGDANSTESIIFYDAACTEMARDTVRIFSANGTSESVNRTQKQYALGNATPIAQRTSSIAYANATFGSNGYPTTASGFDRSATNELDLGGAKTILGDDELVMLPATSGGVNTFCGDSAGYNATGIASLGETFGWQGSVTNGTRTVNGDGSVTWSSTHAGTAYKGAIGSLAISVGAANSSCPIATPEYALSGGASGGTSNIPVSATFLHGELTNLTISNATLANGNSLDVTTNSGTSPTSNGFITGSISNAGTQLASFAVDTFGDGTLTVTGSGAQYVMQDWHVVK
ncbi:MAG: hypothetical protein KGN02_08690 [bacterium]|nr:hypothetical protein [bacterium]